MVTLAEGFRAPFARYWLSGFLANFGDGVRLAAFPLLAAQVTRSPAAVAAVTAVQSLPWLVLGAGLGVLVDRSDRRRLMVIVDITRAVIIVGLVAAVLAHGAGLALIYITAFATGTGTALRNTAAATCVPRLVDPAGLEGANARVIAGNRLGNQLAGPAAGGWLFGLATVVSFAVNAGALGIAVLLLLTLPSVFGPVPAAPDQAAAPALASVRRDLRDGAAWLWRHADVRDITIAAGVIAAVDAAWFAVLVLYVIQVLHQRPGVYGLLLAGQNMTPLRGTLLAATNFFPPVCGWAASRPVRPHRPRGQLTEGYRSLSRHSNFTIPLSPTYVDESGIWTLLEAGCSRG